MAHTLGVLPGKATFGTIQGYDSQNDYLTAKKSKLVYCSAPTYCNKLKTVPNYTYKYLYAQGKNELGLYNYNVNPFNTGDLMLGQYTNLNLNNVCTVSNGNPTSTYCNSSLPCNPCQNNTNVIINPAATIPFYYNKTIDPLGELFGNTQCGELNFTDYMQQVAPTNIQGIVLGE